MQAVKYGNKLLLCCVKETRTNPLARSLFTFLGHRSNVCQTVRFCPRTGFSAPRWKYSKKNLARFDKDCGCVKGTNKTPGFSNFSGNWTAFYSETKRTDTVFSSLRVARCGVRWFHCGRGMAKSKFEYVKQFETEDRLMPACWIVVRIDGKAFHRYAIYLFL